MEDSIIEAGEDEPTAHGMKMKNSKMEVTVVGVHSECAQQIQKTHTNNTTRLIVHHLDDPDHPGFLLETHACSKSV